MERGLLGLSAMMRCEEIMRTCVQCVDSRAPARAAARSMRESSLGFLPVTEAERRVVGVVTDRDLTLRICAERRNPDETPVSDVMSRDIAACRPGDDVSRAERLMVSRHKARILVMDDSEALLGVISLTDLAHFEYPLRVARLLRQVTQRQFRLSRH